MDLILFAQKMSNAVLSVIFSAFEILSGFEFFIFLFAFLFLVVDKNVGYKFFLSNIFGFLFGSIFLKNIIRRQRPYDVNSSIITDRSRYSFSFPSAGCVMAGTNAFWTINSYKNQVKKTGSGKLGFRFFVFFAILYCAFVCVTKIYFADNFLLDVLLGILIGILISVIVLKFCKVTYKAKKIYAIVLGVICAGLLAFFGKDLIENNFDNIAVFEFCGFCLSILLGCLIEEKKIKFEIKNNLISIILKTSILIIVFLGYFIATSYLPGSVIFVFLKYFVAGIIATIFMPILFKKIQKLCYVFSTKVEEDRIVKSYVVLNEKKTKEICKQIAQNINNGDCVLLDGDLGAGKSFVVRTLLNIFGVNENVVSPTFTLFNDYKLGVKHFYHFDLYRLEGEEEVVNIGFEEIMDDKNAIKFIEWPEKASRFLPKKYKKITIVKLGKKSRNIIFEDYTF